MLPLCILMSMETEKLVGIGTLVVLKAQLSRWLKVIAALGTGGKR
ncbi:unnamed protein product [Brassica oleracea var. botrytis]